MIGFLFFFFGVMATLGMCGLAAWSDFKGFRIPNIVSLIILISFILAFGVTALTDQGSVVFGSLQSHIGAAIIVFLVTLAMFAFKLLGAGDSKMAAAVSLWLGIPGLIPFLFYMSLAGGILAAVSLALKKYKPFKNPPTGTWLEKAQEGVNSVPYGIAIALGAIIAFISLGYFSPDKWAEMINI